MEHKQAWVWVGVVVVILGGAFFIFFKPHGVALAPSQPAPLYASVGQVVPGFPTNLILGANVAVKQSYTINYSSSTQQYTAQWNSSSSMVSLYGDYQTYLSAHGWTIENKITQYAASRGLYAGSGSSSVAVSIVEQGRGSKVTVGYATK